MMKRLFFSAVFFVCAAAALVFLPSCGKEEDDGGFSLSFRVSGGDETLDVLMDSEVCTIVQTYDDGVNQTEDRTTINGTVYEMNLDVLKQAIEESGFMKLPQDRKSGTQPSGEDIRSLHVKMNGKECSMTVSGENAPEAFLRAEAAVNAFLSHNH